MIHKGDFSNILPRRWGFFDNYVNHKRKVQYMGRYDTEGNNIHILLGGYFVSKAVFINCRFPLGWGRKSSESIFSRWRCRFVNHANGFILGLIDFRMLMCLKHPHIDRTRRSGINKNLFISILGSLVNGKSKWSSAENVSWRRKKKFIYL